MKLILGILFFLCLCSCSSEREEQYKPIPVTIELPTTFQSLLPPPVIPQENPLTQEGITLGRKLFFDPILSRDNTLACADCHSPQNAFSDSKRFSDGLDEEKGIRNSMPLMNLAWNISNRFNWDGSAVTLEEQIFEPVTNPIEMDHTWEAVENELNADDEYPQLFEQAFAINRIDSTAVSKAIAQFIRTLVSGDSRFDQYLREEVELTPQELSGLEIFMNEEKGDCFHCHGNPNNPLWTDNQFHNNGLDEAFDDLGLGGITGDPSQFGLFKSPSLRNLAYTAPYMHDGRFETLEEVIDHYSEGLQFSETIDPLMKSIAQGGVQLTPQQKEDLKAFLLSLTDEGFVSNPSYQNPN
ncbi:cytochrome c peroxidase [Gangjinia marincola]|uniref:Cytochrome c peroxidase n=1 Tax=Gangjinia marincola TaxID=578463 RepID=A0ABP3XVB5_9FLAO